MTTLGDPDGDSAIDLGDGVTLRVAWASRTDVGLRREVNEDSLVAIPPLFAVADGMGGHAAGDRASDLAVTRLAGSVLEGVDALGAVEGGLLAAARAIDALSAELGAGAGTTATGVVAARLDGVAGFLVFNVGDSRVYLLEAGEIRRLTVDHSVVQEMVDAGMLTEQDAEHHPDSNVITHALGFGERPRPDVWFVPARTGQRLLLCSDGLTKELGADGIARRLARAGIGAAADALVAQALALGGRDNVTIVALEVLDAPDPGPAPVRALRRRRPRGFGADLDDTAEQPSLDAR
ncbi:MAG: serine/threonine-protein phosphatase [Actinomycetales bacterium]|nr:serine/threonine-protein phosphatase [Actinomycetales bacterium]